MYTFLGNKIAAMFAHIILERFAKAKQWTKNNMKLKFKEAYQKYYYKLVANLQRYSKKLIVSIVCFLYKKFFIKMRLVYSLFFSWTLYSN